MPYKTFLTLFFFSLFFVSCQTKPKPLAKKGVMDLRQWDFVEYGNIHLNGEWEFYWQKFLDPQDFVAEDIQPLYETVPAVSWNSPRRSAKEKYPAHGYGSYRLKILLPAHSPKNLAVKLKYIGTNYHLFANGKSIIEVGKVGTSAQTAKPQYQSTVKSIEADGDSLYIVLHVSNYHYAKAAGIWDNSITLGKREKVYQQKFLLVGYDIFLFGALVIMGFYYFAIFLLRPKGKEYLLFTLFVTLFAMRIILRGEMLFITWFPLFDFTWAVRLDYLSFYFIPATFYLFLYWVFPQSFSFRLAIFNYFVAVSLALIVIFTSTNIFAQTLIPFQIFTVALIFVSFYGIYRAMKKKHVGSFLSFFGAIVLGITSINDMLFLNALSPIPEIAPIGLAIFILAQSFTLSHQFSESFATSERLSNYLQKLNQANSRFVPDTVLNFLEKKSITEIALGENIEKDISLLFCDIRNFTTLSESMTPQETFNFVNRYFKKISPTIRNHNGFVDKYLGDGIMALFPFSPDSAVMAGLDIQQKIQEYNKENLQIGKPPIAAGIGIHKGVSMLATIGEKERFNTIAFSKAVDMSLHLENLTKKFGSHIIISEDIKQSLQQDYLLRRIDVITNEKAPMPIYEVLDVYHKEQQELRLQSLKTFEEALSAFLQENYLLAKTLFEQVFASNKEDKVTEYYLNLLSKV